MSASSDQNSTLTQIIESFKCKNHDHPNINKRKLSNTDKSTFETPEKRNNFSDDLPSSPWEIRRLKTELIDSRSRIVMLETQVQQLHALRKELELVFENEKQTLQEQHSRDRNLINDLESRINTIRKREHETRSDLNETRHKLKLVELKYQTKIEQLEQTIDKLREEHFDISNTERDNSFISNQRIVDLENELSAAEDDAAAQKELVAELQSQLSEANSTKRELELKEQALQKSLIKIKELEYEKASFIEMQQQVKLQQNKLFAYRDLEKEVEKLREENRNLYDAIQNKLLLEEQVLDLQKRLESSKNLHKEIAEYEVKYSHLEKQLNEWNTLARDYCDSVEPDCILPQQLKKIMEQYQQKEIILISEKSTAENEVRALQREINNKKQEIDKYFTQISDLQTLHKNHEALIHRLQKKLLLVSRERNSYRSQLDSYEKELTVTVNNDETSTSGAHDIQKERIENYEQIIDGYRDLIARLENDLDAATNQNQTSVPIRTDQLKRLQAEVYQLRMENEKVMQQRSNLERELESRALQENSSLVQNLKIEIEKLKSEIQILNEKNVELNEVNKSINRNKEKILHFEMNPFFEASEQYDNDVANLRSEIDRLKRKIHKLEQGIECSKMESSFQGNSQEILNLKEQIKSQELKAQRLREVFRATSQEFRDVCYTLFGYKIDRVTNNNYRLTNMYAESADDYLLFRLNEGSLSLLETPFSSNWEELIELHLKSEESIPLLTSSITLELYKRQTLRTQTIQLNN